MSEARTKKTHPLKNKNSQFNLELHITYEQKLLQTMKLVKHAVPMPNITADTWCVLDMDSGGQLLFGKRADNRREIASLTKMMTFYVAWQQF